MNWRRAAVFVLMVALGVLAVVLLSDPGTHNAAHVEELSGNQGETSRVHLKGEGAAGTQVRFGELDFDVLQSVEVAPGQHEDRVGARVHVLSAQPDSNGDFVAASPHVTMLDTSTGAPRGTLTAQQARFVTGESQGGDVTLDLSHLRSQDWSVHGDVRGEFPLKDGRVAHLACEDLAVHGSTVRGPGRVTWTCEGQELSGTDLLWDDLTGRLTYDSDGHVALPAEGTRPGLQLDSGPLAFTLPPGAAPTAGYGELRGGVTGVATDGSRLGADTLLFDGPSGMLTLTGAAWAERTGTDQARLRIAAQTLRLVADSAGNLTSADAQGAVRVDETPVGAPPGWMVADSLALRDGKLHAPGRVTFNRAGLVATGDEFDWDRATGRVDFRANGELAVESDSGLPLAGLHLLAPGGQTFTLPPGEKDVTRATGELRGPVSGTLPDGTEVQASLLSLDGPRHRVNLQGDARLHRVLHGQESSLAAPSIEVITGPKGELSALSAEGGVVAQTGAIGAPPLKLETPSAHVEGTLLTAPGHATLTQAQLTVNGEELSWDQAAGRVLLVRDVRLDFVVPRSGTPGELLAPGGLSWIAPPGAADALAQGHGELRGPIHGSLADGSTVDCAIARADGPSDTLELQGGARATLSAAGGRTPGSLASEVLELCLHEDGDTLHSAAPADFSFGALSGRGTGPLLDQRTGQVHFDSDLHSTWAVPGAPDAVLDAAGGLDWSLPAGSKDPLHDGRGEARGPVHLVRGNMVLDAARLSSDGPGRTVRLLGPATAELTGPGGGKVAAQQSLDLFLADDGQPQRMDASVGAQAWFTPADGSEPAHLLGDALSVDREKGLATLTGHARIERGAGPTLRTVTAPSFTASFDASQQLRSVQASGGVEATAGDLLANADALDWDVPGDLAHLSGHGRLRASGMWMSFTTVELQPNAGRFRIDHVGVVHVER